MKDQPGPIEAVGLPKIPALFLSQKSHIAFLLSPKQPTFETYIFRGGNVFWRATDSQIHDFSNRLICPLSLSPNPRSDLRSNPIANIRSNSNLTAYLRTQLHSNSGSIFRIYFQSVADYWKCWNVLVLIKSFLERIFLRFSGLLPLFYSHCGVTYECEDSY